MSSRRRTYISGDKSELNKCILCTDNFIYEMDKDGNLNEVISLINLTETVIIGIPTGIYVADDNVLVLLTRSSSGSRTTTYKYLFDLETKRFISSSSMRGYIKIGSYRNDHVYIHQNKYVLFNVENDNGSTTLLLSDNGYEFDAYEGSEFPISTKYLYTPIPISDNVLGVQSDSSPNCYDTNTGLIISNESITSHQFYEYRDPSVTSYNYANFNVWDQKSSYLVCADSGSTSKLVLTNLYYTSGVILSDTNVYNLDPSYYCGLSNISDNEYIIINTRSLSYSNGITRYKMAAIDSEFNIGEWKEIEVQSKDTISNPSSLTSHGFELIGGLLFSVRILGNSSNDPIEISIYENGVFRYIRQLESNIRCYCPFISGRRLFENYLS